MKISLIICTYMRPDALRKLLTSVKTQTRYPDEILIIDGSIDNATAIRFRESEIKNLKYFKVTARDRGLTRQRNFGIQKVAHTTDVVCFLDDDTVLDPLYFEELLNTYSLYPDVLGVGGYITNEVAWEKAKISEVTSSFFYFDGYKRQEGSRFKLRRKLGLAPNTPPGVLPQFGHGRSISFLPPSGKIYEVKQLMGGVSSFRLHILRAHQFSTYFEGYGLYEDAEFTFRISKLGKLLVNTNAKLAHYHDASGRPNRYNYGKMVVRNGWLVWRVMHPTPGLKNICKWYCITLLLAFIRKLNIITTSKRKEALTEYTGRMVGLMSLLVRKPKI